MRNSDGSITYTPQGTADSGVFDSVHNTITVRVSVNKLNPKTAHGAAIGSGSVLAGLRGSAFTTASADGKRDIARGGTQFVIP